MMEERIEKALENHSKGYNCAQAVACAFCDLVSMDENTLFKITEGFGAGMGLPNMKRYTDEFEIESTVGVGTTVRLAVYF